MAKCKGFQLTLGFLGSIFLITLSFYRQDVLHEKEEKVRHLQNLRKKLIKEMCDGDKEAFSGGKTSLDDMKGKELDNFIVDDANAIIYCYIPKVACTNWKRVMFVLHFNKPYLDPSSVSAELVHNTKKLVLLSSLPEAEMKAKLKHYTKFLFVRDPFVRLISAYRNKFQEYNKYYYENFGLDILRLYGNELYPPETAEEAFASGIYPSFHNFIQYLLDPQTGQQPFEPHWRQMHHLCQPCLIEYDFVGHQETLQEDAEQLLRILNLENDIKFPPSNKNMTKPGSVLDWFKPVPLEDRRKLYKLYEQDFRLFGYRKPSKLLDD
ncbi:Carbohydrate sulfotransferase 12 [Channa argus]|uniref:Carbohydrate sulfotransferase n=2 Tax=Channa argus TaxID=215402 RepID=A0A6G1Q510_CHAAH|nr:Carbohydrate sulfotransferase 12 [Channa argus]